MQHRPRVLFWYTSQSFLGCEKRLEEIGPLLEFFFLLIVQKFFAEKYRRTESAGDINQYNTYAHMPRQTTMRTNF